MITIEVHGQQVQAKLAQLQHQTENLQPIFENIGQGLRTLIIDCFEQEKSPDGINWAAISPATRMARAKRAAGGQVMTKNGKHTTAKFTRAYLSGKILNDTGRLKDSFAHVATNSHVEITTDTMYAPFHQFGTENMPARPFFPTEILPQNWETEILEIINNHLQN
jgi:phage gpG-like protein